MCVDLYICIEPASVDGNIFYSYIYIYIFCDRSGVVFSNLEHGFKDTGFIKRNAEHAHSIPIERERKLDGVV